MKMLPENMPVSQRMWIPEPNSGCWLWLGATNKRGYGKIVRRSRQFLAHRVMYAQRFGDPGPLGVLHKCDVTCCVNPDHLYAGTQKENVRDAWERGRTRPKRGVRNGRARLTPEVAEAIRKEPGRYADIAVKYGTSFSTVGRVKRGEAWTG